VCISLSIEAHPNKDFKEIQKVIQIFFSSICKKDVKLTESILADNFSKFDRIFLTTIMKSEVDRLSQSEATISDNEDGTITVAPIAYYTQGDNVVSTSSITLKKEQGIWKIAIIDSYQLPNKLNKDLKPNKEKTRKIKFNVVDEGTGDPVFSRVHIEDEKGEHWPVNGHLKNILLGWQQDVGGDVQIGNKTYAYVEPEFIADLPEGKYSIEVYHGMEYLPEKYTFMVDGKNDKTISIALRRWINMNKEGWYSGDTHVHFLSDRSALLESQAEDLNIINIVATKWGELITDVDRFTGEPSRFSNHQHVIYVNEESRHGFLGHTILHPLKQLIYPLSWGTPGRGGEGLPGGFDYPPMAHLADKAHAQGAIVTAAHFPYPPGEIAVDVALGKIDSIDLFTFGDAFYRRTSTFHGFEMPTPVELWYKFLNTGAILTATAGTDKMRNIHVVGSVRTYVHLDGYDLSYTNWIAGIKKGKTFVTTGPMIWLTADNKPIGSRLHKKTGDEVLLKARVKSATPVKELELIKGGQIIAKRDNPNNLLELSLEIKARLTDSTWFAARAYSPEKLDYQRLNLCSTQGVPLMAHSSPIYVEVDEKPITSKNEAIFLMTLCDLAIKWAEKTAHFQKPEHKQEMLDVFHKAKDRYRLQAK
jgi:hypothetical protein